MEGIIFNARHLCRKLPYKHQLAHSVRTYSCISVNPRWTDHNRSYKQPLFEKPCGLLKVNLLGTTTSGTMISQRNFSRESLAYYMSSDNPPIRMAQEVLESVHNVTGLPWWASILFTTVGLRTIMTIPLAIFTQHNSAKLELLQIESGKMARQLKAELVIAKKTYGWTDREVHRQFKVNMKRIMRDLYQRDNCHPMKNTLIAWVQIPLWISMSLALRNMSGSLAIKGADNVVSAPSMAAEGCLWFPDLLACDTTWILPVAVGVFNIINIELFNLEAAKVTRMRKIITNTLRVLSVVMVPIAANVPSCMALYWSCSSGFSLGQNLLFKLPSFRRLCRVPKVPSESQTPFYDLRERAVEKYFMKKKGTGKT